MKLNDKILEIALPSEKYREVKLIQYRGDGSIGNAHKLIVNDVFVTYPKIYIEASGNKEKDFNVQVDILNYVQRRSIREAALNKIYDNVKDHGDRDTWILYDIKE